MEYPYTAAVIVAAGNSVRMGVPKPFIELGGVPVIARTLRAFDHAKLIREIVLVVRSEDMAPMQEVIQAYPLRKPLRVLDGGDSRQQSVTRGVGAVSAYTRFVAIHDGDRPLILPATIDRVVMKAFDIGAAAAAVRVKDTIKTADSNGCVICTLPRNTLWSVQTPQVFSLANYRQAMAAAGDKEYTDDCQLAENAGFPVQLVEAEYRNLKITTPEDLPVAEEMLRR